MDDGFHNFDDYQLCLKVELLQASNNLFFLCAKKEMIGKDKYVTIPVVLLGKDIDGTVDQLSTPLETRISMCNGNDLIFADYFELV